MSAAAVGSRDEDRLPAGSLAFAEAMSRLASGVVLVTCVVDGKPWGMTVTAFHSISLDPPTVFVSLGSDSTAARAIARTGRFNVEILAAGQKSIARRGAAPGLPKHLDRLAFIPGALAHLGCEAIETLEVADHTIVLARVLAAATTSDAAPLVYHRRAYRTLDTR